MTIYFPHPTDCDCVIAVEIGVMTGIDLNYPDDDWDITTHPVFDDWSYNLRFVDEWDWDIALPFLKGNEIQSVCYNSEGKTADRYWEPNGKPIDDQSEQEFYKRRIEVSTI